jgi:hypothetical protein
MWTHFKDVGLLFIIYLIDISLLTKFDHYPLTGFGLSSQICSFDLSNRLQFNTNSICIASKFIHDKQ